MNPASNPAVRLNELLVEAGAPPVAPEIGEKFAAYLALLERWNVRTNLTAIRDSESILRRHFVESIVCARNLPVDIVSLLDFGSGAGFPGLPIAIVRPETTVTLAESQNKKAAFLREAVRVLGLQVAVHSGRAEELQQRFNCVTLRAVDHMEKALPAARSLLASNGWLAVLTTNVEVETIQQAIRGVVWKPAIALQEDTSRILFLGQNYSDTAGFI